MAILTTRPFSPIEGYPFNGYLVTINAGQERKLIEVLKGEPKDKIVEFAPGRYSVEWIEAEKEPVSDIFVVPDKNEVTLAEISNREKAKVEITSADAPGVEVDLVKVADTPKDNDA